MSGDLALEITGLGRRLGDFRLHDVDLRLPTGYVMGFVGPRRGRHAPRPRAGRTTRDPLAVIPALLVLGVMFTS